MGDGCDMRPVRDPEDLPGPRGLPILGNALQVRPRRFHLQLEQWSREYGPFYKLRFGNMVAVVVSDHDVAAAMLRDRPQGFSRSARIRSTGLEMGLPASLFGSEGEDWQRQRRLVMASFDPGHVRGYFPSLQHVAGRLVRRWQRAADSGATIDLQADLMRYTVDTIAGLAFGSEVNTLESDGDIIQQHLDKIFPALNRRMLSVFPYWRYIRLPADRRLDRSVAAVRVAVDNFVARARARLQADPALRMRPGNLLEAMVAAADQPGSGIDDTDVAGNVFGMLLAGEDTTANTLAWCTDLLWRNPGVLARATAEVRSVIDGATIGLEQIGRLDYLEACIHETMRLKPVAPLNSGQALRDTTLGGVRIRKGMLVVALMRHDGTSDRLLPRAAAFAPERWLAEPSPGEAAGRVRRMSMPFGAGPRMCPGRYLALLEMKVALASLLAHFDIDSVFTEDGRETTERLAFTMAPVGLRMRLRKRAG